MKQIYNISNKYLKFNEEGKTLFNYLMNYKLLENNVMKKISESPLTKNEFEVLLYSLRFIFNTQISNKTCFYNDIIKNTKTLINSNYIPGTFPKISEYERSYNKLQNLFSLKRTGFGYYICKDCGYLYEVPPSGFPMDTAKCPNGHIIGGNNHLCYKKDLRIFETQGDYEQLYSKYNGYYNNWFNSFEKVLLKDF